MIVPLYILRGFLTFLILHRTVCQDVESGSPFTFMFLITSSIENIERRQACRLTWLTWVQQNPSLGYLFYVEKPITEAEETTTKYEAEVFKDVLIANFSRPRMNNLQECSARRWDMLQYSYGKFGDKYQYYVFMDDDSFVCVHHLLHDAAFWPKDRRMHLAHFKRSFPDVISVYGSPIVKEALQLVADSTPEKAEYYLKWPVHNLLEVNLIKDVAVINELRLMYGAQGNHNNRYNDWKNGWVGAQLLSGKEKSTFCEVALSSHQVYPLIMMDLWSYVSRNTNKPNYSVPELSTNIVDLDKA